MHVRLLFFLGITFLMFSLGCKKETTSDWAYCQDCAASVWVGNYEGNGDYFSESSSEQLINTPVEIRVEQLSDTRIKFYVLAPDLYEASFTATKNDNYYYINLAGSSSSLIANLTQNDAQNRLTGTAKHYHYVYTAIDTTLVIDHSLSFEVISTD